MSDGLNFEYTNRRNIENKLLECLSEEDKIAVVLTKEDLDCIIGVFFGMQSYENPQSGESGLQPDEARMLSDLQTFRREVFGDD